MVIKEVFLGDHLQEEGQRTVRGRRAAPRAVAPAAGGPPPATTKPRSRGACLDTVLPPRRPRATRPRPQKMRTRMMMIRIRAIKPPPMYIAPSFRTDHTHGVGRQTVVATPPARSSFAPGADACTRSAAIDMASPTGSRSSIATRSCSSARRSRARRPAKRASLTLLFVGGPAARALGLRSPPFALEAPFAGRAPRPRGAPRPRNRESLGEPIA